MNRPRIKDMDIAFCRKHCATLIEKRKDREGWCGARISRDNEARCLWTLEEIREARGEA